MATRTKHDALSARDLILLHMLDFSENSYLKIMELQLFCFLIFVSHVQSQAVLSVLDTHVELSSFNRYVNASANLTSLLSTANNFTLLAPSNTAFDAFLSSQSASVSDDEIEAILTYHLLHGGFPTLSFSDQPQFVASHLTNTSYANVTGGQRLELVSGSNGSPQIVSGNKSVSSITTTVRSSDDKSIEII